ncbi:MAG: methionyl-tRNA formyltransferase [Rickettsiales bacterium]|jgi:methionyl-tRNA formyltransferase|nr:methionyl-tRNA formyltransferase [Rickettsiales bacterium]
MRIVFMGTPEFAVPFLKILLDSGQNVIGVYTKKPKKSGRGQKLCGTPIHNLALAENIPVFTPATFKNGKNLEELKVLKPDLIVVVAYGLLLPGELLAIPRYGCINVHPSLLPRWRGCAPMERSIMSGDRETGICLMKIDEGLDSGDIISSSKISLEMTTDIDSLRRDLASMGIRMLTDAIEIIERDGSIPATIQESAGVTFSSKITDEDSLVDWQKDDVKTIHGKIMALNDSLGVHLVHRGCRLKLLKSSYTLGSKAAEKRGIIVDKNFSISCVNGTLKILKLQREGKRPLDLEDFLNGYRFNVGDRIE